MKNKKIYQFAVFLIVILVAVSVLVFDKYPELIKKETLTDKNIQSQNPAQTEKPRDPKMMENMDHMSMSNAIIDDRSFLEAMIPHHQEAVFTSRLTLQTTQDPDLKTFLNSVITDQTKEIDQMKAWYNAWYNQDYINNGKYTDMMGDLSKYNGFERDKMYVKGMIMHHQGAIEMAQSVLKITQKEEIKTLANNIIANQNNEITQLTDWTTTKYNEQDSMMMQK